MEGVIGLVRLHQRSSLSEPRDHLREPWHLGKSIARALEEQHRHLDQRQMRGSIRRWLSRRMQRKSEEHETLDTRQWCLCLGL